MQPYTFKRAGDTVLEYTCVCVCVCSSMSCGKSECNISAKRFYLFICLLNFTFNCFIHSVFFQLLVVVVVVFIILFVGMQCV